MSGDVSRVSQPRSIPLSSSEVVALLVESFGLLAQVLFVDHVGPSGRQVLVLCAECVEVPRAAARSGFLLHHTFGEHGHLDGADPSGYWCDDTWQLGGVGVEVSTGALGVRGEPGVDDQAVPGVDVVGREQPGDPGGREDDVGVAKAT